MSGSKEEGRGKGEEGGRKGDQRIGEVVEGRGGSLDTNLNMIGVT